MLDIEDNALKIVTLKGNSVVSAIEEPLAPGLVKDGVVLDPPTVGQIIKDTFRKYGITEKNVIVSVSGIGSIYRVARLPKLSGDLMTGAVKQEMARQIPVPHAKSKIMFSCILYRLRVFSIYVIQAG